MERSGLNFFPACVIRLEAIDSVSIYVNVIFGEIAKPFGFLILVSSWNCFFERNENNVAAMNNVWIFQRAVNGMRIWHVRVLWHAILFFRIQTRILYGICEWIWNFTNEFIARWRFYGTWAFCEIASKVNFEQHCYRQMRMTLQIVQYTTILTCSNDADAVEARQSESFHLILHFPSINNAKRRV